MSRRAPQYVLTTYFFHDVLTEDSLERSAKPAIILLIGESFVAKQFATKIPDWDVRAYGKIAISVNLIILSVFSLILADVDFYFLMSPIFPGLFCSPPPEKRVLFLGSTLPICADPTCPLSAAYLPVYISSFLPSSSSSSVLNCSNNRVRRSH